MSPEQWIALAVGAVAIVVGYFVGAAVQRDKRRAAETRASTAEADLRAIAAERDRTVTALRAEVRDARDAALRAEGVAATFKAAYAMIDRDSARYRAEVAALRKVADKTKALLSGPAVQGEFREARDAVRELEEFDSKGRTT